MQHFPCFALRVLQQFYYSDIILDCQHCFRLMCENLQFIHILLLQICDRRAIIYGKGGDLMNIGLRIKQRRKELGMSGEELAKRLGKNRSTVFRYENGEIENLPLDVLEPIAKALQTTPQYLMGWEEVQKNNDIIADIVVKLRTDNEFLELVKTLNNLDKEKIQGVKQMLKAFL